MSSSGVSSNQHALDLVLDAVNAVRSLSSFAAAQPASVAQAILLLVTPDAAGFSPLHHASARGDVTLLAKILAVLVHVRGPFPTVDVPDRNGATALHWAIERAQPAIIKALLESGASPNAADAQGRSPLQVAILATAAAPKERQSFYHDMVRYLLQSGADVFASDMSGATCVHTAAATGDGEILSILVELAGAPVNAIDESGENALFYAIRENHFDLVPKLLHYGVDASALNESQEDVVEFCRSLGDEKATEELQNMMMSGSGAAGKTAPKAMAQSLGQSMGSLFGSGQDFQAMWASNPVHLLR